MGLISYGPHFQWFSGGGGPLILLPGDCLRQWEGSNQPSPGRVIGAQSRVGASDPSATDYERACDVRDYLALLPVGDGTGLIVGGDDFGTAWRPAGDGPGGMLICWGYAWDEKSVVRALSQVPEASWVPWDGIFRVGSRPAYLFDSVYSGEDIARAARLPPPPRVNDDSVSLFMEVEIAPGTYRAETAEYKSEGEEIWLVLHRLRVCADVASEHAVGAAAPSV